MTRQMNQNTHHVPLACKYKPTTLNQVQSNITIRNKLQTYIERGYLPHLLFVGETGTGKNLMADCLVRDYLGKDLDNKHFLQICGSINRKRDIISSGGKTRDINAFIRIKVKQSGKLSKSGASSKRNKKKIVLIREFHCMTTDAQTALRTVMEKHANSTCFILTCSDQDNLVEAIQSRVIPMVFTKTSSQVLNKIIQDVIEQENKISPFQINSDVVKYIIQIAEGKIGVALNHLQLCNGLNVDQVARMFDINIRKRLEETIHLAKTTNIKKTVNSLQSCNFDGYQPCELFRIIINVIATTTALNKSEQFNILRDVFRLEMILLEDEATIYLTNLACILCKHTM